MGEPEIQALEEGRAFVDLSSWWKVLVSGTDAPAWLEDLVTNRVADLRPGLTRRALLLDRTGHVRADFGVARMDDGFLLVQDPVQPSRVEELLDRYVLSSDVRLEDRTAELGILAQTAGGWTFEPPWWQPSVLGVGFDWILERTELELHRARMGTLTEASLQDLEVWRIRRGVPRFGIDFGAESLPQEAGLDEFVDATKGCFVGQEAVAKVRNLGHPPRVVRAYRSPGPVQPGEPVFSGEEQVGHVTSVALAGEGSFALLARIRWEHREAALTATTGKPLVAA